MRTFSEWDDAVPGFVEIDLVGHEGGVLRGRVLPDAGRHRRGEWLDRDARGAQQGPGARRFAAIRDIREALPFPLLGIDSDNGSEFINNELLRYCKDKRITFTRSRAYRKNDGCYVEQKNWSVVRRNVGYARFDTAEELAVLNGLYAVLREHTNFFMPSAKLVSKTRDGAKVTKHYDGPKTPYARVLLSEHVTDAAKRRLTAHATRRSTRSGSSAGSSSCKGDLYKLDSRKNPIRRREVRAPGLDDIDDESTKGTFDDIH